MTIYHTRSIPENTLKMIHEIKKRGGFTSDTDVIKYAVRQLYNKEEE